MPPPLPRGGGEDAWVLPFVLGTLWGQPEETSWEGGVSLKVVHAGEGVWQGCPHPGAGPSRSLFSRARWQKTAAEVKNVRGLSGCKAVGYELCCRCSGGQETSPKRNQPRACHRSVRLRDGKGRSLRCRRLRGE